MTRTILFMHRFMYAYIYICILFEDTSIYIHPYIYIYTQVIIGLITSRPGFTVTLCLDAMIITTKLQVALGKPQL